MDLMKADNSFASEAMGLLCQSGLLESRGRPEEVESSQVSSLSASVLWGSCQGCLACLLAAALAGVLFSSVLPGP